ncbi:hypothetical protein BDB01DRAFT_773199 [Pilobolus umbonatus]|nr:hypothetical protein BDB01DRAFT_773199 [Pilobolus umbonatus]
MVVVIQLMIILLIVVYYLVYSSIINQKQVIIPSLVHPILYHISFHIILYLLPVIVYIK